MKTPINDALPDSAITFAELFDLVDVQRLQDEFANATGVASIITRSDGTPITAPSNFTCLCSEIIRKTQKGRANCYKSDAVLGRYHPEGPIVQTCLSGGLWDAGAAITVGGHHVANWLIGQVRDESQTVEKMRAYAHEIGADESAFMKAFQAVPAMSRERFERVARMLFTFANQLSAAAYQNLHQTRLISELRVTEGALRLKNLAFDSSLAANSIAGLDGAITELNDMFLRLWGYHSKDEVLGKLIGHFLCDQHEADAIISTLQQKGQWEGNFTAKRRDGSSFIAYSLATVVRGEDGAMLGFQSSVMDISERLHAEAELQKMQKLTSLGTLAGGIAHDFNNIMMGLFGNIALAKNEFPKDHSGYKVLEDAEKSMGRAIRLTKQLLIFAKGGEPVKESISLGALVEDVVKFDLAGSNVRCEFSQAPDLWTIKADKGQVQQVISNLTINAREAMPNGGHFYVSLENVELKDEDIASLKHGKFIKLVVRDEGVGIDSKMTERIFDPYFPAEGVCAVMGEKGVAVIPAGLNATTRILILDDEEVIRMVVPRWLKRAGCSVVAAADGQQALTLYKQALNDGVPFDVGILDLTIPGGIGGVEVAKAVLAFQPEARLIASSGYADGAVMSNFAAYGFKGVIAKPYTEDQLREVLDKILA